MSAHIHTLRMWCAAAPVLVPALLMLGWALLPRSTDSELAQVTGRVTCAGRPFSGSIYFLPLNDGAASAIGLVKPDGSFQLYLNGDWNRRGAVPGTYRVVVRPRLPKKTMSHVVCKYEDPQTSDLQVDVGPDWNHVRLNLH